MQRDRRVHPSAQRTSNWFAHIGVDQNQPESTTSSAQNQVQNNKAAPYVEETLPLARKAREQVNIIAGRRKMYSTMEKTAVKNNFPFSFHDNKHCLQNVGEYFDFGLGRRKVEPERRQQNSQNFFQWAHEPVPSKEDGLTIYQTSFMRGKSSESPIYRRYPKQHPEKQCPEKPILEKDKNLQPNKSS